MITLATLEQSSAQEVFDQVATHLLTQKKKSMQREYPEGNECCAYRGEGGTKCAAGCLISDEEFMLMSPSWNHWSWKALWDISFIPTGKHFFLICDLQVVHDTKSVESWRDELKEVAHVYELSDQVLKEFE